MEDGEGDLNRIGYADIGGLGEQLTQIRELIELPIRHPKLFTTIGVRPPKGVLMHGPPGTGKTLIAKAVANETGCTFRCINGPEVMSGKSGEAEKKIRSFFEEARENAPAIIFIDEIDSIAPNREKTQDETLRRMVATLLTEMDGMDNDAHIMVIGATNRPNALDPALRRAGRFDSELVIGVPSEEGRREILGILTRKQKLDDIKRHEDGSLNMEYVDLDKLANVTMGFVGADLANLCSKAAISAITKAAADIDLEADILPVEFYEKLKMGMSDFMSALPDVPPSALKEFVVAKPSVTFDDIGGLEDVKNELMEMIEFGKDDDGYFDTMGIKPPSGCMFYGPPGCGKTLLAKAMANEMESNFISIKGPELSSKWFGESEENLRNIFDKGRQVSLVGCLVVCEKVFLFLLFNTIVSSCCCYFLLFLTLLVLFFYPTTFLSFFLCFPLSLFPSFPLSHHHRYKYYYRHHHAFYSLMKWIR
jgi:transitional endoplasmic reticulum ATPase